MKKNRVISKITSLVLLFWAFSMSLHISAASPTVTLGDVTVEAGGIARVTVTLENNPGIIALRPRIHFDDTYFSFNSVVDGGVLNGKTHASTNSKSPYTLFWYDATSNADNYANGQLATVLFNVDQNTPEGTYELTLELQNKDAVKNSLREIGSSFELVNGSITVTPSTRVVLGDVDGDGYVDEYDLSLLESYFVGFDVEINEINADVDGDGNLNRRDLLLLSQYLEGEAEI